MLSDAITAYTGPLLGITIQQDSSSKNYFVNLAATELSALTAKEQQRNVVQLDKSKADNLRNVFANASESIKVPMFATAGISRATMLLPPITGQVANLAFDFLFSLADSTAAAINETRGYIAQGGTVYKWLTLLKRKTDENIFLSISTEYGVVVGSETRTFVIQDCIYPVSVFVKEFETTDQFNNKIIRAMANGTWSQWDIEDKKYDSQTYLYSHQQAGFYYFDHGKYRISFVGGPFQILYSGDSQTGTWKSFYRTVIAR